MDEKYSVCVCCVRMGEKDANNNLRAYFFFKPRWSARRLGVCVCVCRVYARTMANRETGDGTRGLFFFLRQLKTYGKKWRYSFLFTFSGP